MIPQNQNLSHLFNTVTQYFTPKIIAEVNDVYVKLAKVKGQDVPWHTHEKEDELFYVIKGNLTIEFKDHDSVQLNSGEICTVKAGVEHRVHSEEECWLMLIENKSTQHTGKVKSAITKSIEDQHY
jgi:mannose-6-phosphate isomerase-like protein (cupin superfamily)